MSIFDQKPFQVTAEHVTARWSGRKAEKDAKTHPLFRCAWCGHRFEEGDTARLVITNTNEPETEGLAGNPFICSQCDGPRDVILAKLRATQREFAADRFWWFRGHSPELIEAVNRTIREEQRAAQEAYDAGRDEGYREGQRDLRYDDC